MALLFYSSCGDHLTETQKSVTGKWALCQDATVTSSGYNGTKALDGGLTLYTRPRCVASISPSPSNEIIFGWRWFYDGSFPLGGATYYTLAAIHYSTTGAYSASTKQLSININTDGSVYAARGNFSGAVLGTSASPVLTGSTWIHLQVHVVIDATNGSVAILKDNVPVLTISGVNTRGLSVDGITAVEFIPWRIDDCYIVDGTGGDPFYTTFLGKGFHVTVLRPTANESVAFSTPSTNYAEVDDSTPDGSKNSTQFAGAVDLFQMETLTATKVLAVQPNVLSNRASVSVPATVAPIVRISGTDFIGPSTTPDVALTDARSIWQKAPDDDTRWTDTKINAARWGYTRAS